jgi:hypothetical protein
LIVLTTCKRVSQYSHGDITFETADAVWCQPVVLNLPNSRSTRGRADGQAERLLLVGLV